MRRLLLVLALLPAAPAGAEMTLTLTDAGGTRHLTVSDMQAAQLLLTAGRLADARALVARILARTPGDNEALFLAALIATADKDYDAAIADFRRLLARAPASERVRLELARAFFLKGDYDNARLQFQRARAGAIPDTVKANIDRFLIAIARQKHWSFSVAMALAPDTNENAATSVSQVDIYGLPFTLDSQARQKSGVGLFGEIRGEYSPNLADWSKLRLGADAYRTEYSGGRFDDMTVSAYAGPQLLFSGWDVSLLATGFQRWYANRRYVDGIGGQLAADFGIASNWQAGIALSGQDIGYAGMADESGPLFSLQAGLNHTLSPSSVLQLQAGYTRQTTALAAYSYGGWWVGAGYQQDLPLGFALDLEPSLFQSHYDAELAGFGRIRHDQALTLHLGLLNRRVFFHGFTPQLGYTFTDQHSDIAFYGYRRSQFQIGLTSQF